MYSILFVYAGENGFYAFVEVSFDTTYTTQHLSDLCIVGNAIGQLLFSLPRSCGLNDLVTACDSFCGESYQNKLMVCS